jgi:hypothetical protein
VGGMTEPALDFSRYVPERPRLAWSQPDAPARPGELGQVFSVIRNALALIRQCFWIAASILCRRIAEWFGTRVLRSLYSAWLLCGLGWGGFIGYPVYQYFF